MVFRHQSHILLSNLFDVKIWYCVRKNYNMITHFSFWKRFV